MRRASVARPRPCPARRDSAELAHSPSRGDGRVFTVRIGGKEARGAALRRCCGRAFHRAVRPVLRHHARRGAVETPRRRRPARAAQRAGTPRVAWSSVGQISSCVRPLPKLARFLQAHQRELRPDNLERGLKVPDQHAALPTQLADALSLPPHAATPDSRTSSGTRGPSDSVSGSVRSTATPLAGRKRPGLGVRPFALALRETCAVSGERRTTLIVSHVVAAAGSCFSGLGGPTNAGAI
jgi:hypothetical protein